MFCACMTIASENCVCYVCLQVRMVKVKQVGLLAAGCQPWNKDVCAASGDRFAYCATLAIYIYQVKYLCEYSCSSGGDPVPLLFCLLLVYFYWFIYFSSESAQTYVTQNELETHSAAWKFEPSKHAPDLIMTKKFNFGLILNRKLCSFLRAEASS